MATMFEDLFTSDTDPLSGHAWVTVQDPDGITPPSTIIQTDDDWSVKVNWHIHGPAAGMLGGDWTVTVYYESLGDGPEGHFDPEVVSLDSEPAVDDRRYETTIDVAAGELPAGAYRLTTLINHSNLGAPQEMAAFVDGPVIQLYVPD